MQSLVSLTPEQVHSITLTTSGATGGNAAFDGGSGRLEYNEERHVAVKAPIDGVVVELKRVPGETVAKGDVLAVVSGPALAQARALARSALAERQLARPNAAFNPMY